MNEYQLKDNEIFRAVATDVLTKTANENNGMLGKETAKIIIRDSPFENLYKFILDKNPYLRYFAIERIKRGA